MQKRVMELASSNSQRWSSTRSSARGWKLPNALGRLRTRLASRDDGDRQFVKVLAAVQENRLEAVEAACAEALDCGACSADVDQPQIDSQLNLLSF